ncbi:SIR2 family protein [Gordoniibacillus kamchatkensis]|uniref:SIR2 family protein n=1 Tax=Gordoniibacillus kamchatkensis TaxID=1590651 RepID=UPI00069871FD|nr:SIR2 family protein [Paenibacillus sp. VKM B-2647]
MEYMNYISDVSADIKDCLNEMGTQPILFVGSGLSQRFFNGPSWIGLLEELQRRCPLIKNEVGFYLQDGFRLEDIGTEYTNSYREWAWANKQQFPSELFDSRVPKSSYIKYQIKKLFEEITPGSVDEIENVEYQKEIRLLRNIQPHAIITTNYDTLLEKIFPDYQPVIGQQVLKPDTMAIGEIFKIHGCITDYRELVFNNEDYEVFINKKKYLSAKLLTFFAEHPLLFIGYSGNDKNILSILSDIDEIILTKANLFPTFIF